MGFKKDLKALEILEKSGTILTGGFNVNCINHSKWFSQKGSENIVIGESHGFQGR